MSTRYFVMIMDVIGSSKLPDRDAVTVKLGKAIEKVNSEFKRDFLAPFEITKGDEVAAVLTAITGTYDIITVFHDVLLPVDMRTVIVYDSLNAGLESRQSSVIDGPAFHRGNVVMNNLKKKQKIFAVETGESTWDRAAEALMNLLLWQWKDFTPQQQKIVRLYQEYKNQSKVAREIGRTQQQVQLTLEACRWEIIDNAEEAVRDLFRIINRKIKEKGA